MQRPAPSYVSNELKMKKAQTLKHPMDVRWNSSQELYESFVANHDN